MGRLRNLASERWYLGIILLIGLLAFACGGDATSTPIKAAPTATVAPVATPASAVTVAPTATKAPTATVAATVAPTEDAMMPKVATLDAVQVDLGVTMLVDGGGLTVYLFTNDELGKSNCSGQCADFWPPLLTVGDPIAGEGVSADQLGTIQRDDGSTQVTYNGWPLYNFANDAGPGEANGQEVGDVWYIVSIYGGPIQVAALVETSDHPVLGTILTDRSGRTQYLFTPDNRDVSNCGGPCALFWPPLLTVGDPTPGENVSADQLGTIERDDGSTQVTYNGWPLYYFAFDTMPGDTNGQDSQDAWYVVSTHGGPIQTAALVETSDHADLGTTLTDRSGRTQYLFTPDNRDVSNCSGVCAEFWPPLLTVGDPTPGENVSADQLGTIERDDGSTQVTYNGWPLYYFAFDTMPGDTNGQDSQDAWYVVSTHGGPIQTAALVETSDHADLGTILTDRSGRTQYLFTPDNRDVSNCSGVCAEFWPPLLTVGDPTPGEGVSADQLVLSQLGFGNCLRKRLRLLPFFRSVDVGGWQPWDENGMWSGWKGKNETSWND